MFQGPNRIEQNMINLLDLEDEEEDLQFDMDPENKPWLNIEPDYMNPETPFQLFNRLGSINQSRYWKYMRAYSSRERCCTDGTKNQKRCSQCKGWGSIQVLVKLNPHLRDVFI